MESVDRCPSLRHLRQSSGRHQSGNMTALQLVCAVVLLAGVASATVAEHQPCPESIPDLCTVDEIRIDPCSSPSMCILKKGTPAAMSFDFTPKFSANNLKTDLYWASDTGDVAFPDLFNADACGLTACPTESGKTQQLNYSLKLNKKWPQGIFKFKWVVWNADDKSQLCCFMTKVKLRR